MSILERSFLDGIINLGFVSIASEEKFGDQHDPYLSCTELSFRFWPGVSSRKSGFLVQRDKLRTIRYTKERKLYLIIYYIKFILYFSLIFKKKNILSKERRYIFIPILKKGIFFLIMMRIL